jgi:hypothetical protein
MYKASKAQVVQRVSRKKETHCRTKVAGPSNRMSQTLAQKLSVALIFCDPFLDNGKMTQISKLGPFWSR